MGLGPEVLVAAEGLVYVAHHVSAVAVSVTLKRADALQSHRCAGLVARVAIVLPASAVHVEAARAVGNRAPSVARVGAAAALVPRRLAHRRA